MAEYIDKDKAIDEVFEAFADGRSAYIALEAIPAADVQPVRHGRWIDHQKGRWVYAKCSECVTVHDVKSNYCPICGAKMDGET